MLAGVVAISAYVWFRFEWQFAAGVLLSLVHDVLLTVGIFCLLQLEFDLSIVAALLTILGYSVNDTVVVSDRIRENLRKYKRMELNELLDISINETLSRTIGTSATAFLAVLPLALLTTGAVEGFAQGAADFISSQILGVFETASFLLGLLVIPVWVLTVVRERDIKQRIASAFSPGVRPGSARTVPSCRSGTMTIVLASSDSLRTSTIRHGRSSIRSGRTNRMWMNRYKPAPHIAIHSACLNGSATYWPTRKTWPNPINNTMNAMHPCVSRQTSYRRWRRSFTSGRVTTNARQTSANVRPAARGAPWRGSKNAR